MRHAQGRRMKNAEGNGIRTQGFAMYVGVANEAVFNGDLLMHSCRPVHLTTHQGEGGPSATSVDSHREHNKLPLWKP